MISIESVDICDLPITRSQAGVSKEARGNAVLLVAQDLPTENRATYDLAGCIREGGRIASCDKAILDVLDALEVRYCPWPDEGYTLFVLDHTLLGMVADRLVVSRLMAEEAKESKEPRCDL